jgi:hypothetical protein
MHQATKKSPRSSVYPTREEPLHHAILSKFLVDKKCFLPSIYRVVREKELGKNKEEEPSANPTQKHHFSTPFRLNFWSANTHHDT